MRDQASQGETLWRTADRARTFIIPDTIARPAGGLALVALAGDAVHVDPDWAGRFEVTADQAHAWAAQEFGIALGEMRRRLDRKLGRMRASLELEKRTPVGPDTRMTPDAVPALLSLAKALPRAILDGLSGDATRVAAANAALGDIAARLNRAGVAVDRRVSDFPGRLAGLRAETERANAGADDTR